MTTFTVTTRASGGPSDQRSLGPVHAMLTVQSVLVVMAAVNRLTPATDGFVDRHQSLRWMDLINMLVLPLVSVLATTRLRRVLRGSSPAAGRGSRALDGAFVVGVYLLGAGYGMHEVTNYLHVRFCAPSPSTTAQLCGIIAHQDDELSHWVFFAGFALLNLSVLLSPVMFTTVREPARGMHLAAVAANAVVFAVGIFANLAFEELGLDLYVVATVALVAAAVWWPRRRDAIAIYYLLAYWLGLGSTAAYQLLG